MMIKNEYRITGRVQMVMYRDFVQRTARKLRLVGFVKNNKDGSVTALGLGEEGQLKKFEEALNKGSLFSRVDKVESKNIETSQKYQSFDIVY